MGRQSFLPSRGSKVEFVSFPFPVSRGFHGSRPPSINVITLTSAFIVVFSLTLCLLLIRTLVITLGHTDNPGESPILRSLTGGNSLVVQWLGLGAFTVMAQVQSLVRELRSCKLCGGAKKQKPGKESYEVATQRLPQLLP